MKLLGMRRYWLASLFGVAAGCASDLPGEPPDAPETIRVTSSAFQPNGPIPALYSCEGREISPSIRWSGSPPGTRSVALIVEDPDAPGPTDQPTIWTHWIVYNLPVKGELPENARELPPGALRGANDWERTEYGGPCPPVGLHRYVHRIYALDTVLPDLSAPTRRDLLGAMEGHVLARGALTGTYRRTHP
jgi:Raf kinase inhibitor-like YbhB/YbcL family protein